MFTPLGWGVGGLGWGLNYLCAHIHLRFRHAHHETRDWLPSLGLRGGYIRDVKHGWRLYIYIYIYTYLYIYYFHSDLSGNGQASM